MHFGCMLYMFYLDAVKVDQSSVTYVAMAIHVCCKCMFQIFQLFQMYVASVSSGCCVYCSGYTRMLQVCFQMFQRFIWMLHVFIWILHICSGYTGILQVYVPNILSILDVCCKCFICLLLYVTMVIYICCKRMFQLFLLVSIKLGQK
jgi:hypothetical protein